MCLLRRGAADPHPRDSRSADFLPQTQRRASRGALGLRQDETLSLPAALQCVKRGRRSLLLRFSRRPSSAAANTIACSPFLTSGKLKLARNILVYAGGGDDRSQLDPGEQSPRHARCRPGTRVPVIDNVELAIRDGFSTSKGLGLGLPGTDRLMDDVRPDVGGRRRHDDSGKEMGRLAEEACGGRPPRRGRGRPSGVSNGEVGRRLRSRAFRRRSRARPWSTASDTAPRRRPPPVAALDVLAKLPSAHPTELFTRCHEGAEGKRRRRGHEPRVDSSKARWSGPGVGQTWEEVPVHVPGEKPCPSGLPSRGGVLGQSLPRLYTTTVPIETGDTLILANRRGSAHQSLQLIDYSRRRRTTQTASSQTARKGNDDPLVLVARLPRSCDIDRHVRTGRALQQGHWRRILSDGAEEALHQAREIRARGARGRDRPRWCSSRCTATSCSSSVLSRSRAASSSPAVTTVFIEALAPFQMTGRRALDEAHARPDRARHDLASPYEGARGFPQEAPLR